MRETTWLQIVVILAAGLVAGFVNALAGGGSFLTLVALEFAGLPASMANGTNRVAVLVQNVAAVLGFKSKGLSDFKLSLQLGLPAFLGSIVGAYVVIDLPTAIFHRILAAAMLVMLVTLVLDPKKLLHKRPRRMTPARRWLGYLVFFAVGFYGGAIQAGVGFFLIAALVFFAGLDLVRTNSHKVFIIGLFTLFALLMFVLRGQVHWVLGLVLSAGNAAGAWIASRLAVEKGEKLVKIVLGVMLTVVSLQYLGVLPGVG